LKEHKRKNIEGMDLRFRIHLHLVSCLVLIRTFRNCNLISWSFNPSNSPFIRGEPVPLLAKEGLGEVENV